MSRDKVVIQSVMQRAKMMAHQLRALPSLKEDWGLSPSNQTVDQNCV